LSDNQVQRHPIECEERSARGIRKINLRLRYDIYKGYSHQGIADTVWFTLRPQRSAGRQALDDREILGFWLVSGYRVGRSLECLDRDCLDAIKANSDVIDIQVIEL
jgi:hypothetical protein